MIYVYFLSLSVVIFVGLFDLAPPSHPSQAPPFSGRVRGQFQEHLPLGTVLTSHAHLPSVRDKIHPHPHCPPVRRFILIIFIFLFLPTLNSHSREQRGEAARLVWLHEMVRSRVCCTTSHISYGLLRGWNGVRWSGKGLDRHNKNTNKNTYFCLQRRLKVAPSC